MYSLWISEIIPQRNLNWGPGWKVESALGENAVWWKILTNPLPSVSWLYPKINKQNIDFATLLDSFCKNLNFDLSALHDFVLMHFLKFSIQTKKTFWVLAARLFLTDEPADRCWSRYCLPSGCKIEEAMPANKLAFVSHPPTRPSGYWRRGWKRYLKIVSFPHWGLYFSHFTDSSNICYALNLLLDQILDRVSFLG